ncbi:hypothetical protein [Brevibacillus choshinensis]|uniref:Uncharacterized protein n=1 Tax=Brevibacillus choshinensis TaxID=54911 RepID=A0ABX7FYK4_BRECH|nr:hypothetical protein [Brevibacillus choshinensis]QRG70864.1 hypothetical protein JNE38_06240 [Brevibacillus choshinensis]
MQRKWGIGQDIVLLSDGSRKLLIFNQGGRVLLGGGGTSHYSKPHIAKNL